MMAVWRCQCRNLDNAIVYFHQEDGTKCRRTDNKKVKLETIEKRVPDFLRNSVYRMTPEERLNLESPASRRCSFKGKDGTIVAWDASKKTFAVEMDECGADGKWVTVHAKEVDIIWNESEPPLIVGEDDWLSQPFFKALSAIFQAFDKDEDGLLSRAELRHFSVVCNENGRCFSDEELQEISDYFDWNEDAVPEGLSITGWLDMYHTQTSGEEAETLGDLKRLGFDSFLNWTSKPSLTDAADKERPRKIAKKE